MNLFKIIYALSSKEDPHTRYYRAESEGIAVCMFSETVEHGSLTGYKPKILRIIKL
jgi:hypothetical protein